MAASAVVAEYSNPGTSLSRRERLWLRDERKCHWCGRPTRLVPVCNPPDMRTSWDAATTDHVVPRYKGGSNDDTNLVSACALCNNRRNYEDAKGLAEGSLMGKYQPRKHAHPVALTADEKKAIMSGQYPKVAGTTRKAEDVLREQRDQALQQLEQTRELLKAATEKLNHNTAIIDNTRVRGILRALVKLWVVRSLGRIVQWAEREDNASKQG
ncbi:MAG: HNH endonuclease [Patescibacteria group bacterium]|nr:HNH endonuclease [Patescibacteria group bacterium]